VGSNNCRQKFRSFKCLKRENLRGDTVEAVVTDGENRSPDNFPEARFRALRIEMICQLVRTKTLANNFANLCLKAPDKSATRFKDVLAVEQKPGKIREARHCPASAQRG